MADLNVSQVQSLSGQIEGIKNILKAPGKLNQRDFLAISDTLEEVQVKADNIAQKATVFIQSAATSITTEAQQLFARTEEIKQARALDDNREEVYELLQKVDELADRYFDMMPLEVGYFIDQIDPQIKALLDKNVYSTTLQRRIDEAQDKLDFLRFKTDFPVIEDLYEDAPFPTYAHRLLNEIRDLEIENPTKANELKEQLEGYRSLGRLAYSFMYKDINEAISTYEKLLPDVKAKIDENVWRLTGKSIDMMRVNPTHDQKTAISAAIMAYVANEIY